MYQTTPPQYYSHNNFKIKGQRSVGRVVFDTNDITNRITVNSYKHNNEWRISKDPTKYEKITFKVFSLGINPFSIQIFLSSVPE